MININTVKKIEKIINYSFKKKDILINSFSHPSFLKDKKYKLLNNKSNFERLEFLGDRVLGIVIASLIFNKFKDYDEGELSKKLSYLVQRDFLYKIGIELKLDQIFISTYKESKLKINKSILSDTVESLIGSVFIDGGYLQAYKFINKIWGPYLNLQESNEKDPKTKLQEISQQKNQALPEYKLIKKSGPSHSPNFTVSLKVLNINSVRAIGSSKRDAEKNAAIKALKLISE